MRNIHERLAHAVCALVLATQSQAKTAAVTRDTVNHIQASLLSYGTATDKVRDVEFDGQRLKLIVHETRSGETRTRTLTWERITTAP